MTTFERPRALTQEVLDAGWIRSVRSLRASRTRRALWRLAATLIGVLLIASAVSGCASANQPKLVEYDYEAPHSTDLERPGSARRSELGHGVGESFASTGSPSPVTFNIPDDPRTSPDQTAPETQRLADLMQRDVDLILSAQRTGGWSGAGTVDSGAEASDYNSTASASLGSTVTPPRRVIEWNEPLENSGKAPESSRSDDDAPAPTVLENADEADRVSGVATTQPSSAELSPTSLPAEPAPELPRPDRIRQLMIELSRELYADGAYSEHPLRELSVIAAMSMHQEDRQLDPSAIPDLTEEERELLAHLQTFFINIGKTLDGGSELHGGIAEAAATLRQSLVQEPVLRLPRIALCTRVGGFGDYTPFDTYTFLAGSDQRAIVYLEIEGFVSELNANEEFVTELAQQLTIYSDRDGIPVWKEDWLSAVDVTRNKRQDFFTTQIIALPKALGVGKYTLKVRARDERSNAETETSISFELVADPRMID